MNDPCKSLGGGLGYGVKIISVPSMKLCHLFKTFWFACPFMAFNYFKTSSHCNVVCFELSSLKLPIFNFFKVFCRWSFKVSLESGAPSSMPLGNLGKQIFTLHLGWMKSPFLKSCYRCQKEHCMTSLMCWVTQIPQFANVPCLGEVALLCVKRSTQILETSPWNYQALQSWPFFKKRTHNIHT
jgi:hypothetical protein